MGSYRIYVTQAGTSAVWRYDLGGMTDAAARSQVRGMLTQGDQAALWQGIRYVGLVFPGVDDHAPAHAGRVTRQRRAGASWPPLRLIAGGRT